MEQKHNAVQERGLLGMDMVVMCWKPVAAEAARGRPWRRLLERRSRELGEVWAECSRTRQTHEGGSFIFQRRQCPDETNLSVWSGE